MNEEPSELSIIAGKNLVIIRKQLHLTQEQCAELIGITAPHLSNFENGKCGVSLKVIEQILKALPITPNELLIDRSRKNEKNGLQDIIDEHLKSTGYRLYLDLVKAFNKDNNNPLGIPDYKIPPKKRETAKKVADKKKK